MGKVLQFTITLMVWYTGINMDEPQQDKAPAVVAVVSKDRNLNHKFKISLKLAGILGVVVVTIIIVIVTVVAHNHTNSKKAARVADQCASGGDNSLASQAVPLLLYPSKTEQLRPVVSKVQALPNYKTNINCLYIVTTYYANAQDLNDAKNNLKLLEQLYSAKASLAPILKDNSAGIPALINNVKVLERLQTQATTNARGY